MSGVSNSQVRRMRLPIKEALQVISRISEIDPEMPLQQAKCLLIVAESEEGMSLTEIANKAGISLATASRYISALGKMNRHRQEGLQLIESFEDPMERRKKVIRLTVRGSAVVRKITGD
jgi:DNA-binding MarR family transcriptional regulator